MLPLPSETKKLDKLADWLELLALSSIDKDSSYGDLSSTLRRSATYEQDEEYLGQNLSQDHQIDEMCGQVFLELNNRLNSAQDSYPFEVSATSIKLKSNKTWENFPAYVFCLCLSYFGGVEVQENNNPQILFEKISQYAAESFMGSERNAKGYAFRLGHPRDELPSSFSEAIDIICNLLLEGQGYRRSKKGKIKPKDDGVDIIAWRETTDNLSSKIIMFGQCASNQSLKEWERKLGDLKPKEFCEEWMIEVPESQLIKSFFVPHRPDYDRWSYIARRGGVIFDRCRIAYWAHEQPNSDYAKQISWVRNLGFWNGKPN